MRTVHRLVSGLIAAFLPLSVVASTAPAKASNPHHHCPRPPDSPPTGTNGDDACPPCGNGVVNKGEECDDGNSDDTDGCLSTCVAAKCGDGIVQAGVEECDDGNSDDYDGCTTKCAPPRCGDGIVHEALGEACDDGNDIHGDGCFDCYTLAGIWAAGDRSCAMAWRSDYRTIVKCWGDGAYGALGQGDTEDRGDDPGEIEAMPPIDLGGQIEGITMGLGHTCAVMHTGEDARDVKCWGRNTEGQLGLGDTQDRGDDPGELGAVLPVTFVSKQSNFPYPLATSTCGFNTDILQYFCFGANTYGTFGNGSTASLGDSPAEIPVAATPAFQGLIGYGGLVFFPQPWSRGSDHLCAVLDQGGARCWGRNDAGQLGIGSTATWGDDPGESVTNVPVDGTTFDYLEYPSVGRAHTCFARPYWADMVCVGANDKGQLGLGHTQNIGDDPGEVAAAAGFLFVAGGWGSYYSISGIGADFNCVVVNGGVYCWGDNASGQLGREHTNNLGDEPGEMDALMALPPIPLGGPSQNVSSDRIVLGRAHACAILDDRRIKCWGDNSRGQLGLGDSESRGDDPGEMGDALPSVVFP